MPSTFPQTLWWAVSAMAVGGVLSNNKIPRTTEVQLPIRRQSLLHQLELQQQVRPFSSQAWTLRQRSAYHITFVSTKLTSPQLPPNTLSYLLPHCAVDH